MPYYMSPVDMSFLLEQKYLQIGIGYTILIFELIFVFLFVYKRFRIPLLVLGVILHLGILISLNIYPFGLGMLIHYLLLVPLAWWSRISEILRRSVPKLVVFYDEQCLLCNRTVICLAHFDLLKRVQYLGLQEHAREHAALNNIAEATLLKDLYALDHKGQIYSGLATYIQIFRRMGYLAPVAYLLQIPGLNHLAGLVYRRIADKRVRLTCDTDCPPSSPGDTRWTTASSSDQRRQLKIEAYRWARVFIIVVGLQLNCTVHYGILEPLTKGSTHSEPAMVLKLFSDVVILFSHTFAGITPHSLYVHQFDDYNHIFAFSYRDKEGREQWLPFVNQEGRLISPNWGRVQSMWANISVTGHIDTARFTRAVGRITAYWSIKSGLDLGDATLTLKMKQVQAPSSWVPNLRQDNLAGEWQDVGQVIWKDRIMRLEIHGIHLETL